MRSHSLCLRASARGQAQAAAAVRMKQLAANLARVIGPQTAGGARVDWGAHAHTRRERACVCAQAQSDVGGSTEIELATQTRTEGAGVAVVAVSMGRALHSRSCTQQAGDAIKAVPVWAPSVHGLGR